MSVLSKERVASIRKWESDEILDGAHDEYVHLCDSHEQLRTERDAALAGVARLREALAAMPPACETLMDEVTGKRAVEWGVVNDALVNARKALAATAHLAPKGETP